MHFIVTWLLWTSVTKTCITATYTHYWLDYNLLFQPRPILNCINWNELKCVRNFWSDMQNKKAKYWNHREFIGVNNLNCLWKPVSDARHTGPKTGFSIKWTLYEIIQVADFDTNWKVTSYQWPTATLILSCTVSEIRQLIGWKSQFPHPFSFYALAWGEPFEISGWSFKTWEHSPRAIQQWRFWLYLALFWHNTRNWERDGQMDRQTDISMTGLCITSYADTHKNSLLQRNTL